MKKTSPPVTISTIRGNVFVDYPIMVREFENGDLSLRQRDQIIVITRQQLYKLESVLDEHCYKIDNNKDQRK